MTTTYYVSDQIGSSRMDIAYGSWPTWWGAFNPYGTEIDTNATTNNFKFSGMERDAQVGEAGLDNFGARSYSSTLVGKFMQPDPAGLASANLWNPQSFYLYGYVMNNPLNVIDPTGLDCVYLNDAGTDPDNDGIDHHSNYSECAANGGYWAEGNVASAADVQTYSNTDLITVSSQLNGQSVSNLANCLGCSTQTSDGSLLGSFTQTWGTVPFGSITLFSLLPAYAQGQNAPSSLMMANHSYQGSKQQYCDHQANMAAAEAVIPGGSVLLGGDYRPSTVLSETAEVAADKSIDAAAESAGVLSWLSHATGLARPLIAQGLKFTGILSNGYTALKGLSALGDEYSSCISR